MHIFMTLNVKIGFLKYFLKIKNFFILIHKKYLRKAKGLLSKEALHQITGFFDIFAASNIDYGNLMVIKMCIMYFISSIKIILIIFIYGGGGPPSESIFFIFIKVFIYFIFI